MTTTCPHCRRIIAPNVDKHTCPKRRDIKRERERAQRLFGIGRDEG